MRFATARHESGSSGIAFGPIVGDALIDVSDRFASPAEAITLDRRAELDEAAAHSSVRLPLATLRWLPPIPAPARILCIGVNYADHRAESQAVTKAPASAWPTVFLRLPSSLVGHQEPIVRPSISDQFDYEGELAVVIGRRVRRLSAADALDVVAGWSCFMDGSIRDYQRHTTQFTPGKNFDASGSWGPWIVMRDELAAADDVRLSTTVGGEVLQDTSTIDLITGIADLVAYCSAFTTLEPGDVIATGTPGGVGMARSPQRWLQPGEQVDVTIAGIGTLSNPVVDEQGPDGSSA